MSGTRQGNYHQPGTPEPNAFTAFLGDAAIGERDEVARLDGRLEDVSLSRHGEVFADLVGVVLEVHLLRHGKRRMA